MCEIMQPINPIVDSTLTDLYQLTMAYAYWKAGKHEERAVFDLFFRKNPFGGEFTVFAGLEEVLKFAANFCFTDQQIGYLKNGPLKGCDEGFFQWLEKVDCQDVKLYALREGTLAFPRTPLMRVEGPLAIAQMLETTSLNLVNFPSLIATNAARFRLQVGFEKKLIEFGLRRAQGPDGGLSASRYSYMGGFDGTSNVKAGEFYGIPVVGTHAHSFVQAFSSIEEIKNRSLVARGMAEGDPVEYEVDFVSRVLMERERLGYKYTNEGELAAFISYAQAFPDRFLALVDTYDTLKSGVPNFLCVACALKNSGYDPIGIRLDSGDLAFLSKEARRMFVRADMGFSNLTITASNDVNEEVLISLDKQNNEIDTYGIGTHLVTCQAQPALGGVYKLVEINGQPKIKLSQDAGKVTIPGRKEVFRLMGEDDMPLLDVITKVGDQIPKVGERFFCRHPFEEAKRAYVIPQKVEPLHSLVLKNNKYSKPRSIADTREYVLQQIKKFRPDHTRTINPTPYKVSVSQELYAFIHGLWMEEAPVATLK